MSNVIRTGEAGIFGLEIHVSLDPKIQPMGFPGGHTDGPAAGSAK